MHNVIIVYVHIRVNYNQYSLALNPAAVVYTFALFRSSFDSDYPH